MFRRRRRGEGAGLPPRILRRESDGGLYDVDERRRVTIAELRDEVRAGRRFRASRHDTGSNCTNEVLAEVLAMGAFPGVKGPGLGAEAGQGMATMGGVLGMIGGGLAEALRGGREGGDPGPLFEARRQRRTPAGRPPPPATETVDPQPEVEP